MKKIKCVMILCALFVGSVLTAQTARDNELMVEAKAAMENAKTLNLGINEYFKTSAGYVIFPNVGKGALIIGAASGNGIVYQNKKAVGSAGLKKLNIGAQIGGASFTEIIFFEDVASLEKFKEGDYEFAAELSAVALQSGKSLNAQYRDGVAVVAIPKAGLMAELSVGGQKFSYKPFYDDGDYDTDDN